MPRRGCSKCKGSEAREHVEGWGVLPGVHLCPPPTPWSISALFCPALITPPRPPGPLASSWIQPTGGTHRRWAGGERGCVSAVPVSRQDHNSAGRLLSPIPLSWLCNTLSSPFSSRPGGHRLPLLVSAPQLPSLLPLLSSLNVIASLESLIGNI